MDEDVASQTGARAAHTVRTVGVIDAEREVVLAPGVERLDAVKTLRHLLVALFLLRAELPGQRADRVIRQFGEAAGRCIANPQLEHTLTLEGAQENFLCRIADAPRCEKAAQLGLLRVPCGADS